jgi:hypothetical protein
MPFRESAVSLGNSQLFSQKAIFLTPGRISTGRPESGQGRCLGWQIQRTGATALPAGALWAGMAYLATDAFSFGLIWFVQFDPV